MVGTISPLVKAATADSYRALFAYALGSLGAAALVGSVLGLLGATLGTSWSQDHLIIGALALMLGLAEAMHACERWSPFGRQTEQAWRSWGSTAAAFLWGADIGNGITTRINHCSQWLLFVGALTSGAAALGAALLVVSGVGRLILVISGGLLLRHHQTGAVATALIERRRLWNLYHVALLVFVALSLAIGM
jgi:hypothetical protein